MEQLLTTVSGAVAAEALYSGYIWQNTAHALDELESLTGISCSRRSARRSGSASATRSMTLRRRSMQANCKPFPTMSPRRRGCWPRSVSPC
jgi:hypothetical protein